MDFAGLLCGVYSEFVQQRISDASMALFTAVHSTVGFSFIHSIVQLSLLLATCTYFMFEIDFLFLGDVATYICQVCHMINFAITIVEHDTRQ